jgi:hypothetical protein
MPVALHPNPSLHPQVHDDSRANTHKFSVLLRCVLFLCAFSEAQFKPQRSRPCILQARSNTPFSWIHQVADLIPLSSIRTFSKFSLCFVSQRCVPLSFVFIEADWVLS